MSKLIRLNKRNGGCPVCGGDDGACRQSPTDLDFILCKTNVDARLGDRVGDYVCVKQSNGHTASFKLSSEDWTEEQSREYKTKQLQEQQLRKQKQEIEDRERQARAMSSQERHQHYSTIAQQLTLDSTTIDDLRRRGFSQEEIARNGFVSVKKWQKLDSIFPDNLPGIGKGNNTLIIPGDGYLCPVRNVNGEIVGFQLRLHNLIDGDDNRYRWLSSSTAPVATKEFNELPLAVYIPSQLKSFDIQLTEGTGVKPFLAAERLGMVTIGASGGNHLASPETLKHTINTVQELLLSRGKEIVTPQDLILCSTQCSIWSLLNSGSLVKSL